MAYDYTYGMGLGPPIAGNTFRITSGVGPRKQFATSGGQRSSTSHAGVDIATPVGTPLLAPFDGTIVHVVNMNDGTAKRNQRGYGNMVVVRRADGTMVQMSHLHSANVKVGDTVRSGQQIGLTGNSGSSTGPHLDYIVLKNGMAMRPDGTAYRAYNKPWLGGSGSAVAPQSQMAQASTGALLPAAPAAQAPMVAPQLANTESSLAPRTDWLAELEKENAVAQKLAEVTEPKPFAPVQPPEFFTARDVQAAQLTKPQPAHWVAGASYHGY